MHWERKRWLGTSLSLPCPQPGSRPRRVAEPFQPRAAFAVALALTVPGSALGIADDAASWISFGALTSGPQGFPDQKSVCPARPDLFLLLRVSHVSKGLSYQMLMPPPFAAAR
jgi:hypothetical protein